MANVSIDGGLAGSAPVAIPTLSARELAPWAAFAFVLGFVLIYLVGMEEGALRLLSFAPVHEFVHDGRHLLGFPCH